MVLIKAGRRDSNQAGPGKADREAEKGQSPCKEKHTGKESRGGVFDSQVDDAN